MNKISHLKSLVLLVLFLTAVAKAQQPSNLSSDGAWGDPAPDKVSSTMSIVVIVLVLFFFLLCSVSIFTQQCATASSTVSPAVSATTRGINAVLGLDKTVIDTFPTFLYSAVKELKIGKESLECAVCLCEFEENETLRLIPKCDHVFHQECIDAWLDGHVTCPVCRADLLQVWLNGLSKENTSVNDQPSDISIGVPTDVRITIDEHRRIVNDVVVPNRVKIEKFPRSHSTGHSLIQPGENCERFTLRLPPEVRRQLLARNKLKRTTSLVALPWQSSSRRGYREGKGGDGSGSSRYGRYFGRSFISRLGSFKSTF